jgi:hypothetical protein
MRRIIASLVMLRPKRRYDWSAHRQEHASAAIIAPLREVSRGKPKSFSQNWVQHIVQRMREKFGQDLINSHSYRTEDSNINKV